MHELQHACTCARWQARIISKLARTIRSSDVLPGMQSLGVTPPPVVGGHIEGSTEFLLRPCCILYGAVSLKIVNSKRVVLKALNLLLEAFASLFMLWGGRTRCRKTQISTAKHSTPSQWRTAGRTRRVPSTSHGGRTDSSAMF
jgi:hypothetical protein